MPLNLTDDKSTLIQVMAWCHQATSHYLSQCWPRSMSPYVITKPQWVKLSFLISHTIWYTQSKFHITWNIFSNKIYHQIISLQQDPYWPRPVSWYTRGNCGWGNGQSETSKYWHWRLLSGVKRKLKNATFFRNCHYVGWSHIYTGLKLGHHCACSCPST